MAFFDNEELSDCLRHNLALLDDTGLTGRIILAPKRRAPAEGLPLEFVRERKQRQQHGEWGEEEEEPHQQHPSLRQLLENDGASTSNASSFVNDRIRSRLLARLAELEEGSTRPGGIRAVQCAGQKPGSLCQIRFESRDPSSTPGTSSTSFDMSKLLAETKLEDTTVPFAEFAKFEAMASSPNSKRFAIVFPAANCAISIHIVRTASIGDLIGLACHVYSRQHKEPACESLANYQLYLAEEDTLEYDTELPPQDRHRRIADCGFPALAMVSRSHTGRRPSHGTQLQANIFLTDGRCYALQLESLDVSLEQVFEYAMDRKRRDDELMGRRNPPYFLDPGYVLEPLDHPGHQLDLNCSVSSSGTTEFVLLRRNSSRGENLITTTPMIGSGQTMLGHSQSMIDFTKEGRRGEAGVQIQVEGGGSSKPSTPSTVVEIDWTKRHNRFSVHPPLMLHQQLSMDSLATLNRASGVQIAQLLQEKDGTAGAILEEFEVNRIHRFHPKTPCKLVVRDRYIELVPVDQNHHQNHRRKVSSISGPKKFGKTKCIPLELMAAVEVPPHSEQRSNARRTVRIIFLGGSSPTLSHYLISHQEQAEYSSAYEGCCWKTLLIDASGHEAWNIGVRLSELLDLRPSPVHLLYQHSAGATMKPFAAAEKVFGSAKSHRRTGSSTTTGGGGGSSSSGKEMAPMAKSEPERQSQTRKKLSLIFSRNKRHNVKHE